MTEHRVVLYSKPGCHLCELTHQLLLGLCRDFALTIQEVDITSDPALYAQYWDKIPVIVLDGHATLTAPIRVSEIRSLLVE